MPAKTMTARPTTGTALVNRQFGLRVEQLRSALGWTQEELSKKVGLARVSVTNIETGRQGAVTLETVEKFAKAFGTSPKHLLKGIWL
jgi:transcriptional regulator with XRE-family HTH domain